MRRCSSAAQLNGVQAARDTALSPAMPDRLPLASQFFPVQLPTPEWSPTRELSSAACNHGRPFGSQFVFRIVFKKRRGCRTNAPLPPKRPWKIRGIPANLLPCTQEVAGSTPVSSTSKRIVSLQIDSLTIGQEFALGWLFQYINDIIIKEPIPMWACSSDG